MADLKTIAQTFASLVAAEPGFKSALHFVPEQLPSLPTITMLLRIPTQEENETGPHTANTWAFDVDLIIPLGGRVAGSDFQAAQEQMMDLLPKLLGVVRHHPDLNGTCIHAIIEDSGDRPVFDPDDERTMTKTVLLTVRTEEV